MLYLYGMVVKNPPEGGFSYYKKSGILLSCLGIKNAAFISTYSQVSFLCDPRHAFTFVETGLTEQGSGWEEKDFFPLPAF